MIDTDRLSRQLRQSRIAIFYPVRYPVPEDREPTVCFIERNSPTQVTVVFPRRQKWRLASRDGQKVMQIDDKGLPVLETAAAGCQRGRAYFSQLRRKWKDSRVFASRRRAPVSEAPPRC